MDILAHALWSNAAYEAVMRMQRRERSRKIRWIVVSFGIAPDLFAFTAPLFSAFVGDGGGLLPYAQARLFAEWRPGYLGHGVMPNPALIPGYVYELYNFSHSFVIFTLLFFVVWLIRGNLYWPMAAWGLHVLTDIFTHSEQFFPTPILFPFSSFHLGGISWADPIFLIANYTALVLVYASLYRPNGRKLFMRNAA